MEPLKKHGDPLEDEVRQDPAHGIEEVASNQPGAPNARTMRVGVEPGSKGRREEEDQPIVRSADQKPNANQPDNDATTPAETDLNRRRSNM
jgi:hypothetical protein